MSRSVPALDGIRGLAILSVVWFHFLPGQMPGGWMGMSIFFPLSGFLVTRLLLDGIEQHHVDVLAFWERRARRLLPALWVMLAITSMLVVVHRRWGSTDTGATLSSLLGVNNWWQISHSVDYWAALRSGASPFEHLWSLSVEMQFYLVLPILAAVAARRRASVATFATLVVAIAIIGAAIGLFLGTGVVHGERELTEVYYDTLVRSAEMMAGAATAVWSRRRPSGPTFLLDALATIALAAQVALWFTLRAATDEFVGRGGMALAGVGTCCIIAAAVRGEIAARALSWSWLRWLGTRSYSLYLWHWPVVVYVDRQSSGFSGTSLLALRIAMTLGASVLSHATVEQRFRRRRSQPVGRVGIEPTTDGL